MDGVMECVSGISNQCLRNFVGADQQYWADYVGLMDFIYVVANHLLSKQSPFMVAYGVNPLQLGNLSLKGTHSTLKFNQDGED